MIVLDASAALELLLNRPLGKAVAERVFAPDEPLHAPHLVDLEIVHVLARLTRRGDVEPGRAWLAVERFGGLAVVRYPHEVLLPGIWALRENATAHDAAYLTFAAAPGAALVTCDAEPAGVPGSGARVEVVA